MKVLHLFGITKNWQHVLAWRDMISPFCTSPSLSSHSFSSMHPSHYHAIMLYHVQKVINSGLFPLSHKVEQSEPTRPCADPKPMHAML